MIAPAGRKKLRPAPGVPESIVIQPQPEGRELIIPRFTGIIEQMCFEIGHRTIAAPTVIPQPSPPPPTPHQTHMVCNAEPEEVERQGGRESKRGECAALCCMEAPQCCCATQQFSTQTAGKAINPCTFWEKKKKII